MLKCIRIIPNEQIVAHRSEAWELIKDHSPEDVMFIACALAFEDCILWSDDKKLKKQSHSSKYEWNFKNAKSKCKSRLKEILGMQRLIEI